MAGISRKDIKNRIRSMESTRQITRAMELVAASNLRRAQTQVSRSRPYFQILSATIREVRCSSKDFSSPFLRNREGAKALYIVIAGDRGLAGGYNSNLLKMVHAKIREQEALVLPIGKKAVEFCRSKQIPTLSEAYKEASVLSIGDCFSIAKEFSSAFLTGAFGELYVAYTTFVSVLSQIPVTEKLLPLEVPTQPPADSQPDMLYEGTAEDVFAAVIPEYLGGILYGALCESRAAEQAARRAAMDSATQNADDRIAALSQAFNRTRQAAITQEITEMVVGF